MLVSCGHAFRAARPPGHCRGCACSNYSVGCATTVQGGATLRPTASAAGMGNAAAAQPPAGPPAQPAGRPLGPQPGRGAGSSSCQCAAARRGQTMLQTCGLVCLAIATMPRCAFGRFFSGCAPSCESVVARPAGAPSGMPTNSNGFWLGVQRWPWRCGRAMTWWCRCWHGARPRSASGSASDKRHVKPLRRHCRHGRPRRPGRKRVTGTRAKKLRGAMQEAPLCKEIRGLLARALGRVAQA